jgi:hypothetical protein
MSNKQLLSPTGNARSTTSGIDRRIQITRWTANAPVTKRFSLDAEGQLVKRSTASQLYDGTVEVLSLTMPEFGNLLTTVGPNHCLSYGIPRSHSVTRVLSVKRYEQAGSPEHAMTRTTQAMDWPDGPAILMIDYDADDKALTKDELCAAIYDIVPQLRNSAHIWCTSTSSCIHNEDTEESLRGICGQRIYIAVEDGRDIPRAGNALFKRLWLAGHGYIRISSAGSMLTRTLADAAVWQPNRIDYCAPPACDPPLASRKPAPELLGSADHYLDSRSSIPSLTDAEEAAYEQKVAAARDASRDSAIAVQTAYIDRKIGDLVAAGVDPISAKLITMQAVEQSVLSGAFMLRATDGSTPTVSDLLSARNQWHGRSFADPIEPEYHGDNRIARAVLHGVGRPYIFSYAHGGRKYFLSRAKLTIRTAAGERGNFLQDAANYLSTQEYAFRYGTSLVEINDSGVMNHIGHMDMLKMLDHNIRFEHFTRGTWRPTDAKAEWAKLLAGPYVSSFKPINGVLTAPTLCPRTATIIDTPGYHRSYDIFILGEEQFSVVSKNPSLRNVQFSLQILWAPLRYFPFVASVDQSVMLAAMLTCCIRAMIKLAPCFAFDAPIQGSGKTLLIMILCAMSGQRPTVSPPTDSGNDEEMRKRIFSSLREGAIVLVIDNIVGAFDSPALASMLTSEHYNDRVLRESRTESVLNKTITLMSGNNLLLKGDLPRRVLTCRIDPKTELPHKREFDFDPVAVVAEMRQELVAAALTLMLAYLQQNGDYQKQPGRLASFEEWDDLVRQTVCWLAQLQSSGQIPVGNGFPELCDPILAVDDAVRKDPIIERHGCILREIAMLIGLGPSAGNMFSVKQLIAKTDVSRSIRSEFDSDELNLRDLLIDATGDPIRDKINSRLLGTYFSRHKDRVVRGLCLRSGGTRQNVAIWYVEATDPELNESLLYGESSGSGGSSGSISTYTQKTTATKRATTKSRSRPTKPTRPTKA